MLLGSKHESPPLWNQLFAFKHKFFKALFVKTSKFGYQWTSNEREYNHRHEVHDEMQRIHLLDSPCIHFFFNLTDKLRIH